MKKILYLLPLLIMTIACALQPAVTPDVSNRVSATLTAIAAANPQGVAPQLTFTPIPAQPALLVTPAESLPARDFIPELGTVTGSLSFPSSFIPSMRVAFFSLTDGSISYTDTGMNQGTYSIELPAGSYHVVAYPYNAESSAAGSQPEVLAGGYTQFVLCGSTADCTDHSLISVTVTAGQTIIVNPGDWYAPAGTFPPMPNP